MQLSTFLEHSAKVQIDDLDWALARRVGLGEDEARLLNHIAGVEDQTPFYMLELMKTPARLDTDTVGFLTMWNYEEYFHARALHRFLEECGRTDVIVDAVSLRRKVGLKVIVEDLIQRTISRITPTGFAALYFTWGASQEYLTTQVYGSVAQRTKNPVLAELCRRIAKQERRHYAWYYNSARERLAGSAAGRRLTRFVMDRLWSPVGVGVHHSVDPRWVIDQAFGETVVACFDRLEGKLNALPGLDGVRRPSRFLEEMGRDGAAFGDDQTDHVDPIARAA